MAVPTMIPPVMCESSHFPTYLPLSLIIQPYSFFPSKSLFFISLLGFSLGLHRIYILILEKLQSIQDWVFPSRNMVFFSPFIQILFVLFSNFHAPTSSIFFVCLLDFRLFLPILFLLLSEKLILWHYTLRLATANREESYWLY